MERLRVIIFYKSIPHYRYRFYEVLRSRLLQDGITLEVIYGGPVSYEVARHDRIDLPWGWKRVSGPFEWAVASFSGSPA